MGDLDQQQKEWFSRAFVTAVSAAAGYTVEYHLDDVHGVDATVRDGGVAVDFQLKATSSPIMSGGDLAFDLDVRTYDLLSGVRSSPGYLLVIVLPEDVNTWLQSDPDSMTIFHSGYWRDLTGLPATSNENSVRIKLPLSNTLCVTHIREIMLDARGRLIA
ncbi:DUF4365 domain-containing protein [Kribbella sp. NPDC050124]|uniref:DUF4365 domain-containing protein n=1 Tax=Kribbella sp. NPDC050124 TaxID=3364114 RepID=UPI0037AC4103